MHLNGKSDQEPRRSRSVNPNGKSGQVLQTLENVSLNGKLDQVLKRSRDVSHNGRSGQAHQIPRNEHLSGRLARGLRTSTNASHNGRLDQERRKLTSANLNGKSGQVCQRTKNEILSLWEAAKYDTKLLQRLPRRSHWYTNSRRRKDINISYLPRICCRYTESIFKVNQKDQPPEGFCRAHRVHDCTGSRRCTCHSRGQ